MCWLASLQKGKNRSSSVSKDQQCWNRDHGQGSATLTDALAVVARLNCESTCELEIRRMIHFGQGPGCEFCVDMLGPAYSLFDERHLSYRKSRQEEELCDWARFSKGTVANGCLVHVVFEK